MNKLIALASIALGGNLKADRDPRALKEKLVLHAGRAVGGRYRDEQAACQELYSSVVIVSLFEWDLSSEK